MRKRAATVAVLALALLPSALSTAGATLPSAPGTAGAAHPALAAQAVRRHQPGRATLLAAGDIPTCGAGMPSRTATATAAIIGANHGTVAALGDLNSNHGLLADYVNCYGPTWGRYKFRTRPTPGNHDYKTRNAAGYFAYFGARAGQIGKGYYSYRLGAWHIVVLNSNCSQIGGCGPGSPEDRWLRSDLARHRAFCTLAYWHHPLFSSAGPHAGDPVLRRFWRDLSHFRADVILNGHQHHYERFAPLTPFGILAPARGIREFVVGTAGTSHEPFRAVRRGSQVRNNTAYGVLKLTLFARSYRWKFLPIAGKTFTDAGTGSCR